MTTPVVLKPDSETKDLHSFTGGQGAIDAVLLRLPYHE
jgi:hypothetical protein